jgi:hypothetical protein
MTTVAVESYVLYAHPRVFMDTTHGHDFDALLRGTLRRLLRLSTKGRPNIADELSNRLGRRVSEHTLAKWSGDGSTEWRIPADAIPALSEILHDDTLQRQLLSEKLKEALEVGEWAIDSRWILEQVKIEAGKIASRQLHRTKIYKSSKA